METNKLCICILCKESSGTLVKVTERGLAGLLEYSIKRNEHLITEELRLSKTEKLLVFVHETCRKWFNNKRRLTEEDQSGLKRTRNSVELFNWKVNCFYCGLECIHDRKNPARKDWHLATTLAIRDNVLAICKTRLEENGEDQWALEVQRRGMDCIDFVAAEVRYHKSCSLRFQTKKVVGSPNDPPKQKGRCKNETLLEAFNKTCEWLELEADLVTLQQFRSKMLEHSANQDVYDIRYIKKILKDKYGANIYFSDHRGSSTLICFQDMANFIINKRFKEKKNDIEDESLRIIKAAATLIKAEIRETNYDSDYYPTCEDVKREWIPESLRQFLNMFTTSKLKQESIGQCMVKAASAKKIPPILLAIGVEVDHLYGSRWLNDELFKLGFAVSYSEVTRYKQACSSQSIDEQIKLLCSEGSFTHFIADNVDHNVRTLDGSGTFHGMGIVASTISKREHVIKEIPGSHKSVFSQCITGDVFNIKYKQWPAQVKNVLMIANLFLILPV